MRKFVILTKLRRDESFAFSWAKEADQGSGRNTIWIHPALAIHFEFSGSRRPELNRRWIDELAESANLTQGMVISREPRDYADGERTPNET